MNGGKHLNILLVDDLGERAAAVERGLTQAGWGPVSRLAPWEELRQRLLDNDPDLIIISLDSPDRDTLEGLRWDGRGCKRPMLQWVEHHPPLPAAAALEAGFAAYVAEGLAPQQVHDAVGVAIDWFQRFRRLHDELERSKADDSARYRIERAKSLLMRQRGWTEDEAYRALRRMALDQARRLVEAADGVIAATRLMEA